MESLPERDKSLYKFKLYTPYIFVWISNQEQKIDNYLAKSKIYSTPNTP